jgi:hypothetical protein
MSLKFFGRERPQCVLQAVYVGSPWSLPLWIFRDTRSSPHWMPWGTVEADRCSNRCLVSCNASQVVIPFILLPVRFMKIKILIILGKTVILKFSLHVMLSPVMKMEVAGSSETLVPMNWSTWCHVTEYHNLNCLKILGVVKSRWLMGWTSHSSGKNLNTSFGEEICWKMQLLPTTENTVDYKTNFKKHIYRKTYMFAWVQVSVTMVVIWVMKNLVVW